MPTIFRDLRTSPDTRHVGASLEEGSITLWRTDESVPIITVKPGFEGSRYGIDPINGLIFSGTWEHGLTCLDYRTGKVVWKRRDVLGFQSVNISSAFPSSVFVSVEADDTSKLRWQLLTLLSLGKGRVVPGIAKLEALTGKTIWNTQDGDRLFLHPAKPIMVLQDWKRVRIYNDQRNEIGSTRMKNFAIIDAAFSDDMIALAEGAQGVRILDFEGYTISEYAPTDRKPNCISIAFERGRVCVFDSWEDSFVTVLDPSSGAVVAEYKRPIAGEICFIDEGSRYVDCYGNICRSADGEAVGKLDAPIVD